MTPLEHGLIGGAVVFKSHPQFYWWAFFSGTLSDLVMFSYAGYKVGVLKGIREIIGDHKGMPESVYTVYYYSHSLITTCALFLVLSFIQKDLALLAVPYELHILCDIPFHDSRFSTRFHYPLSNFQIHGYSQRLHRWVHLPILFLIGLLYVFLLR
jgi:hypothetical protein